MLVTMIAKIWGRGGATVLLVFRAISFAEMATLARIFMPLKTCPDFGS